MTIACWKYHYPNAVPFVGLAPSHVLLDENRGRDNMDKNHRARNTRTDLILTGLLIEGLGRQHILPTILTNLCELMRPLTAFAVF